MRKSDKKKNLFKANLLVEQRYLSSKGLIKEDIGAEIEVSQEEPNQEPTDNRDTQSIEAMKKVLNTSLASHAISLMNSDIKKAEVIIWFAKSLGVPESKLTMIIKGIRAGVSGMNEDAYMGEGVEGGVEGGAEGGVNNVKGYLTSKGLKVEPVGAGDIDDIGSKFRGVVSPGSEDTTVDETAYIWDGLADNGGQWKWEGKPYFVIVVPWTLDEDIQNEIKSKFPVLNVGGKSGTYYQLTIEKK